ncbi:MAG TPA: hypothetical protein DCQ04_05545 [Actinobacteria bacterium]|nr:hypothetical protein [Actinomycetota bacterium]
MLPSAHDICPVAEDLDGRVALENYLGRSLAEAERQISTNPLYYIADFMWMGPVAFRFYLPAAHAYFASVESDGDSSSADSIIGILEQRLTSEREEMLLARTAIVSLLDTLLARYQAFEVAEEIWGDLRPKIANLHRKISEKAEA